MLGAAVSMYVPKENSMYVQVRITGRQRDLDYLLIAIDLETGNETAAYVLYNNENVNLKLKLLSLVYDETDSKTYCFVSQIGPTEPSDP